MTDIEIAMSVTPENIGNIAAKLGLNEDEYETYGKYKAKINVAPVPKTDKLVLVTAINPTPFGEGKTTTSIGLADGLQKIGKSVCLALREPSLGPVFGVKGGATGGGHAQVIPMEDINLHFTGDLHAITSANNLISAMIDNHIHQGNELGIDPRRIVWKRCVDLNDRALRRIVCGLGGETDGVPREDGFNITAASEIMAILCLSNDLTDFKRRVGDVVVAYNYNREPVRARDLKIEDACAILMKDAIKPNLVQTLEGAPAIIHGGPFANIAHGCNSVIATKTAMSLADYVITEAGFGADLGAEKFIDIKCRMAGLKPKAVVLVATVRALKFNGGAKKEDLAKEDLVTLQNGIDNLIAHIDALNNAFNANVVVTLNRFITDSKNEIEYIEKICRERGARFVTCDAWANGGEGAKELANKVVEAVENSDKEMTYSYPLDMSIEEKIEAVAKKVYGAKGIELSPKAKANIKRMADIGYGNLPICIAKTQYSLSDDPKALGRPKDFTLRIENVELRSGAGFIVVIAGSIMLMPGLSKEPAGTKMTIDENGKISGLF
jgi:formate--tetrahydrofolate ligase